MNIAICAVGSNSSGMGHIYRELALCETLLTRGHAVTFITRKSTPGETILERQLHNKPYVRILTHRDDYPTPESMRLSGADTFILDVERGPARATLHDVKNLGAHSVVIGGVGFYLSDPSAIDELVDLQIHQSPFLSHESSMKSVFDNMYYGTEYLILHDAFINARTWLELNHYPKSDKVLVSLGGADPHNLTKPVVTELARTFPELTICAVYGPAVKKSNKQFYEKNISIIEAPPPEQMAQLMAQSALVVTALGMTVYEALCVGVPVCCTAWSRDHEETAEHLLSENVVQYLDLWNKFDTESMKSFANGIVHGGAAQDGRIERGREMVDGSGKERVAKLIEGLGE